MSNAQALDQLTNAEQFFLAERTRIQNAVRRAHLLVDGRLKILFHDLSAVELLTAESELAMVRGGLVPQNLQWSELLASLLVDERATKGRVLATTSPGGTLRVEIRGLAGGPGHTAATQPRLMMVKTNTFDAEARRVAAYFGLTGRETEILESICAGFRIKEYAAHECRATETARKQLKSMLKKLGVGSQIDAVRLVYQTYFEEQMAA